MPTEVELKLAVSPGALREAARLPWLRHLASGPAKRNKIVSVYFDTGKCKLRDSGITLRIRRIGRKRIQSIKATGDAGAGRNEWETEIAADKPDLKQIKTTALARLATGKLKRSLRPVFETDVRRIVMPLRMRNSELELAFDRGRITTGSRSVAISELELELKSGKRSDLARLAQRLAHSIPVAYGARAKAERGYALSAGKQKEPVRAGPVTLGDAASTGEAFMAIGLSCLHHLAANEDAVRHGDPEGVHQMRVGLRRLRAAVSIFKDVVQSADTEAIKSELRWLTEQLGPARDFDVLVREGVVPLRRTNSDKPEIALLRADLEGRRDTGFDKAKAAVDSTRYRAIVLRTALWLIDGQWSRDMDALVAARRDRPAIEFAQEVLAQRRRKIIKRVRKLEKLDSRRRHKLRIAVKKLRYATDFFVPLFTRPKAWKARKCLDKVLKSLQSSLGKVNDIAVHERLARQFASGTVRTKKRPQKAYAMGLLTGREQTRMRACLAAAAKAGKDMAKTRPFWD